MADRLVKIQEVLIADSDEAGASPFRQIHETFEEADVFVDRQRDIITRCAHGHVIRNAQQLRGQCVSCGRYLCSECPDLRCELDGNLVCRRHAIFDGETVYCRAHNRLGLAVRALLRGPRK